MLWVEECGPQTFDTPGECAVGAMGVMNLFYVWNSAREPRHYVCQKK
ncbi:MAG: hypothetical protein RL497_2111 [Pseudomonadota bacterium]